MSNNYPWFVGAKLKLKGPYADGLLLPDLIKQDLENGFIIEIVGISENDCPRFIHSLGMTTVNNLEWSLMESEAEHFELVNPRTNNMASPVYVSDLHPKDIALLQAMYMIDRYQKRVNDGVPSDKAMPADKYLRGNFMSTPIKHINMLMDIDANLMNDLIINYNLKGVN